MSNELCALGKQASLGSFLRPGAIQLGDLRSDMCLGGYDLVRDKLVQPR
jgi:hypothetical protein